MIRKKILLVCLVIIKFPTQTLAQLPKGDQAWTGKYEVCKLSKFQLKDTVYLNYLWQASAEFYQTGEADSMRTYSSTGLNVAEAYKKQATDQAILKLLTRYEMIFNKNMGISFFSNGDYTNELKFFHRYLTKAEEINSRKDIGTANAYIADCHRELEDYDQAFLFAQKAYGVLKETDYIAGQAAALAIYGSYYFEKIQNFDSACFYKREVYRLYKENNNQPLFINSVLDLIYFYFYYQKTDSCKMLLHELEPFMDDSQNPDQLMPYLVYKARIDLVYENNKEAIKGLEKAKTYADQTVGREDNTNINRFLALAYAASGRPLEAFTSLDSAFNDYSEDLNANKIRSLTKAQMNFDFEKERAVAAEEMKRQKLMRNFSIAGGLFFLLFALFIFQRYRERHKTNLLLEEKNKSIEKAYFELKETQQELVETEKQREAQSIRVRIARDIHDEIGSGLTKITMLSDAAKRKTPSPELTASLSKIMSYSKGVSSSLSEIVWAINPNHDNVSSLVSYMKSAANSLLEDSGISFKLNFPDKEITQQVHPEIKRNIFLVMKEGINNVIKYSGAKDISINFEVAQNHFKLVITDNGNGFNPFSPVEERHVGGNGLINMKFRMQQHDNHFQVISAPGQGCKIIAEGKLN